MGAVRSIWAMLVATLVLAAAPASAQEPARLALLIGNQGYAAKVGALKNPHTDVALIEAALIKLGFKVVVLKDAGLRAMDTAIKRHVREVNRAGAGALSFFYYSGHGVANPETKVNYLIPVDVTETEDEKIWDEAYQQNAVIDLLSQQAPRATHFVVFDACRNELNITGPAAKSLGADKGFVPIQNTAGLLIAYATAPGKTASDVGSGGGPYATALADELVKPGVEAVSMFRAVQIRVKQAINQDPWLSFPSLPPTFLAGRSAQGVAAPATAQPPMSEAAQAWSSLQASKDVRDFEAFRRQYGRDNPFYDRQAEKRIEELKPPQTAMVAPPKAPEPVPSSKQIVVPTGVFFSRQTEIQTLDRKGDLVGALLRDASGAPLGTIEATIVERGSTVGLILDHRGKPVGLRSLSPLVSSNTATRTVTLDVAQAAEVLAALAPYQKRAGDSPAPKGGTTVPCDGIDVDAEGGARQCIKPGSGKTTWFKDCSTCPEMVVVPAGTFTMGSPASEPERERDEDQARVTISKPFAVGRFAIMFDEWDACVADGGCKGYKPVDQGWGRGKRPVINVSWDDVQSYVAWINRKSGKSYRLLSESEREYVTRAGTTTPFWWGTSITPQLANYNGMAESYSGGGSKGEYTRRIVLVDSFEANPWGLYNVHGNVWEWTEDCWNAENAGNPANGSARTNGDCSRRVLRGGAWNYAPRFLRSASRGKYYNTGRDYSIGFRLTRTLQPAP